MKAAEILAQAASLVDGDRHDQHGGKDINHANIARLWEAYLQSRYDNVHLDGQDVALMMALLKIARTCTGATNDDDAVDGAAYLAIFGELSSDAGAAKAQAPSPPVLQEW